MLIYLWLKRSYKGLSGESNFIVYCFQIVSEEYDRVDENLASRRYFETIYQLLDNASPDYRNSFGNALMTKLTELAKAREREGKS